MMATSISNNFIVQIQLGEAHLKHGFFFVTACVQSTSYFSDLLVKHQTSPAISCHAFNISKYTFSTKFYDCYSPQHG